MSSFTIRLERAGAAASITIIYNAQTNKIERATGTGAPDLIERYIDTARDESLDALCYGVSSPARQDAHAHITAARLAARRHGLSVSMSGDLPGLTLTNTGAAPDGAVF